MNRIGKTYTLKNGYSISKMECYDGYIMRYFWSVFQPDGKHYVNCTSFDKAYEVAVHSA